MKGNSARRVTFFHHKYGQPLAIDSASFPRWTGIVPDSEPHILDFHEFLVVSAGTADVMIGDRAVHIRGPAVLFTPPGVVRRVELRDPLQLELVVFSDAALRRSGWAAAFKSLGAGILRLRDGSSLSALTGIAQLIAGELTSPRPDSALMLDALLAQFLVTLNRSHGAVIAEPPRLAIRFERLLHRCFRDEHGVAAYAAALGVTADHLSAVIRSHYGISAKAMIDQHVFAEAARLLTSTQRSIADISWSLGFDEPSHFTRAFLRACGRSPSRFRGGR